jgi:hypothetical protein
MNCFTSPPILFPRVAKLPNQYRPQQLLQMSAMLRGANGGVTSVEGIISLLDTDLYKLTMQCAVLKSYPDTGLFFLRLEHVRKNVTLKFALDVTYTYTNRTPDLKITRAAFEWLRHQVSGKSFLCLHWSRANS